LISLDTRHPEVAEKAIQTGIDWMNDVSGLENPRMQKIAAQSGLDVVVMHSMIVPPKAGTELSSEEDPTSLILEWAEKRFNELNKNGISRDRIIFDPGFGFGKTRQQSWELLREMRRFHDLGVRILVGHSRKTFLTGGSSLAKLPAASRDVETLALTQDLAEKGIDYLRVHDPESNSRALRVWAQVNGISQCRL
jgi:dihydropteroate synthase